MNLAQLRRLPYAAFDFDGTLADSNAALIRLLQALFQQAGKELTREFLERAKVMAFSNLSAVLSQELAIWNQEEIEQKLLSFTDDFYGRRVVLKPYAWEYLSLLRREGVQMCILSATEERLIRMALAHLGLKDYFLFLATPERTGGRSKGDPDLFLYACRQFDCPDIGTIVLYDDSLEALRTAHAAGMSTIGVYDDTSADTANEIRVVSDGYIMGFGDLLRV